MNSVYQQYSDDIAVIALNPYASDSESAIQTFKASNGLAFPMAKVDTALMDAFNIAAFPTSVVVDRYGTITVIEEGAIISEAPFIAAFEHFIQSFAVFAPTCPAVDQHSFPAVGSFVKFGSQSGNGMFAVKSTAAQTPAEIAVIERHQQYYHAENLFNVSIVVRGTTEWRII